MKRDSLKWVSRIYFALLIMLVSTSCIASDIAETTPTVVPTFTPERLKLIGGEIDPCLLVSVEEVSMVLGVKVASEIMFMDYMPSCKYISTIDDHPVLLIISAVTDASIEKANQPWLKEGDVAISAVEDFERQRMVLSRTPELYKFRELDDLGDQAFLYKSTFLIITFLRNNILYQFNGRTEYGVDFDTLMKIIRIAIERTP